MTRPRTAAAASITEAPQGLPQGTGHAPPGKRGTQSLPDRSLDQWRGLALVLVLVSHAFHFPDRVPGLGRAGVNLFFFISGILVFRSLAKGPRELAAGARYFLGRRARRLLPAKYFYLLCLIALILLLPASIAPADFCRSFFASLPAAFLYYMNYYAPPFSGLSPASGLAENLTGHLWSLACEMQFYLLAPFVYFAGGKSLSRRFVVFGLLLALFLAGGVSVIGKTNYAPYAFQVAAWPMMAGFFAEFVFQVFPASCRRWGKPLVALGLAAFLALAWAVFSSQRDYAAHKQLVVLAGTLLVAGCFGCYLAGVAPGGMAGNALHYLGNRTYSIYLWQQPLTLGGLVPAALHPLGSLLAIPVGALSFHYLERPFMSKFLNLPKS